MSNRSISGMGDGRWWLGSDDETNADLSGSSGTGSSAPDPGSVGWWSHDPTGLADVQPVPEAAAVRTPPPFHQTEVKLDDLLTDTQQIGPWQTDASKVMGQSEANGSPEAQNSRARGLRARLHSIDRFRLIAMLVLGCSLLGLVYSVRNALADHNKFDPTAFQFASGPSDVEPSDKAKLTEVDLPDVRELDRNRAIVVITESGLPESKVTIVPVDQAGDSNIVVRQDPPPGTNSPDSVILYVSREIAMPEYVNKPEADVKAQLKSLGSTVTVEYQYRARTAMGTVLEQSVKVGDPMPREIKLIVAGEGVNVPISKVDAIDSDCSSSSEPAIKGSKYPESVVCSISIPRSGSDSEPYKSTFVLGQEFHELSVTLGASDESASGYKAKLRILNETGTVLVERTMGLGDAETITVPVTGVTQLTFEASPVGFTSGDSFSYPSVRAVFGSPTLITSPDVANKYLKN